MPNSIALLKKYIAGVLDDVYKAASLTSKLDGSPELVKEGANTDEMVIPKRRMF
ncbi:MAG: hypothetical protein J6Y57_02175 [Lachnospiraceae bacterium]|nr:hypothetical protein [Lachnospiraceae bacterium]